MKTPINIKILIRTSLILLLVIFSFTRAQSQSYCDTVNLDANIPDTVLICNSDSINISASAGFASYKWSRGDTNSNVVLSYSGLYYLTVTDDSACVAVDSLLVSVINAGFEMPDTTVCYGDSLSLQAWQFLENKKSVAFDSSGSSISFSDISFPVSNSQRTFEAWVFNAGQSGRNCVFSYGQNNMGKVFSLYIDQNDSLILQLDSTDYFSTQIIPQNTWTHIMVGTDPSQKYSFYLNGIFAGSDFITGTYDTYLDGNAWLGRSSDSLNPAYFNGMIDEVRLWGRFVYAYEILNNMHFHTNNKSDQDLLRYFDFNYFFDSQSFDMNGFPAQLNAASNSNNLPFSNYTYRFLWSSGSNAIADTISYFDTETTSLIIGDDVSTCNYSVNVTVPPLPNMTDSVFLCNTPQYNLSTTYQYSSYFWNTGSVSPVISISDGGNYFLTVSEASCTYVDSVFVSMINVEILNPDTAICDGESITLQAVSNTNNYHWSNDAQTSSVTITPLNSQIFSVSATDGYNTCSDQVSITVFPVYAIGLPDTVSVCNQSYALLNANNPYFTSYLWDTGDTTQFNAITQSGFYQLTATDINGCMAEDGSYGQILQVDILQDDTLICSGASLVLDAVVNSPNFSWSTGETTNSITVSNSGLYSVAQTDGSFTCMDSVAVSISPEISLSLIDTFASCSTTSFLLQAGSPFYSYLWNTGSVGPDLMATTSGAYIVTATNSDGCQAIDTSIVSIISAYLSISDTLVCEGSEVIISTNSTQYEYLWSNGYTDALIFDYPQEFTTYTVFVSDAFTTCTYNTSINVLNVETGPIYGNDTVWADSTEIYYVNPNPGSTYDWFVSGGSYSIDTLGNIEIHWGPATGYVSVIETTADGCVGQPVELYIYIQHPISIEDNVEANDFVIAPNPMNQSTRLIYPERFVGGNIQLYDITGKVIFEDKLLGNEYVIEKSNLAKGIYWVRLINEERISKKLIVH
jgi:hypothetical protein